jgi:hypothetical protein
MHNELRYQAKTHAIADTPRKENNKILASSPPIFFLKKKKTCFIGK